MIHTIAKTSAKHKYILDVLAVKNNKATSVIQKSYSILPKLNLPAADFTFPLRGIGDIVWYNQPPPASFKYNCTSDSLPGKLQTLLAALTPSSASKSHLESSLTIRITINRKQQIYRLVELALSNSMVEELGKMRAGSSVEVYNIKFHSFGDPPGDAQLGPYVFLIKE